MNSSVESSVWFEEATPRTLYPSLEEDIIVDVAIVGGGITGVTAAYLLTKEKMSVALLETGTVGSGETSNTTAMLTQYVDVPLHRLARLLDEQSAAAVWKSGQHAIAIVERIVRDEVIRCQFERCTGRMYTLDDAGERFLQLEYEHAVRYGFAAEYQQKPSNKEAAQKTEGFRYQRMLRIPNQAVFHPRQYVTQLAARAAQQGASIFEHTRAIRYSGKRPVHIQTERGTVTARSVFITTHNPNITSPEIQGRVQPMQTYVIEAHIPSGHIGHGIYWDTTKPYFYFRVDPKGLYDRMLLGGADHPTGEVRDTEEQYVTLAKYLGTILPGVRAIIVRRWTGQVIETSDGLPFIGSLTLHPHLFVATGFSGTGMTYGTLAAEILTDRVLGRNNRWAELYRVQRLKAVGSVLKHNVKVTTQFLSQRIKRRHTPVDDIAPGSGAVVVYNGRQAAVYKDIEGTMSVVSPICTHMKCIVRWNNADKTWDCPCHGSRFDTDGSIINGPADQPLRRLQ